MKILYDFSLIEEKTVKEPEIQKNAEGADIEVLVSKKVNESRYYGILKPTRRLIDEGNLFYTVSLSSLIKLGVLTVSQLRKKLMEEGVGASERERLVMVEVYTEYFMDLPAFEKLSIVPEEKRTEEEKAKVIELTKRISANMGKIAEFESQIDIFNQTAEHKARAKAIIWWALFLALEKVGDKYTPIFGEGDYEDRVKKYDEYYDNPDKYPFFEKSFNKFLQLVAAWYGGRAEKKEDFDVVLDENRA